MIGIKIRLNIIIAQGLRYQAYESLIMSFNLLKAFVHIYLVFENHFVYQ